MKRQCLIAIIAASISAGCASKLQAPNSIWKCEEIASVLYRDLASDLTLRGKGLPLGHQKKAVMECVKKVLSEKSEKRFGIIQDQSGAYHAVEYY